MEAWGAARYGDPCRECGFTWSIRPEDAIAIVATMPDRYDSLLTGQDAGRRHPDLDWSAGEYVCHVTDNLRIWAEHLAGPALTGASPASASPAGDADVVSYDTDLLARARRYDRVTAAGALWSLRHAAAEWAEAISLATRTGVVLRHDTRGEQRPADVARNNAHDCFHHAFDIARILRVRWAG